MRSFRLIMLFSTVLLSCQDGNKTKETNSKIINELNQAEIRKGDRTIALTGATLIDGRGGDPLSDALVIIQNDVIEFAGKANQREIPEGAEVVDVKGLTILPGLIDAHYHNGYSQVMPQLFLSRG